MGFAIDATQSTAANGNAFNQQTKGLISTAGDVFTADIPAVVKDGDMLVLFVHSSQTPTTAWGTPTGWTLAFPQKDGTSSFGGRAACFRKVWRNGDSLTVDLSGPKGDVTVNVVCVRSDTDGASLTIGNPPASGFTSGYDSEGTVATTSPTMPKAAVDSSTRDLRIFWIVWSATGATTLTPPAVTASANNPGSVKPVQMGGINQAGNWSSALAFGLWADPSGTEAGTTVWTISSGRYYAVVVVVHDPNATSNGSSTGKLEEVFETLVPIPAIGHEHVITVAGGGNGGGIAVS